MKKTRAVKSRATVPLKLVAFITIDAMVNFWLNVINFL
jgi:hypothetical protein